MTKDVDVSGVQGTALVARSVLFTPGDRDDLVAKVPRWAPDVAVIDLEDAVPDARKERARVIAMAAVESLVEAAPQLYVLVRVNSIRTPWGDADIDAVTRVPARGIVIPKVHDGGDVDDVRHRLDALDRPDLIIIVGIETVAGVASAADICARMPDGAYFGAEDYVADLGGRRTPHGQEVLYARSHVSMWARRYGVAAIDQAVVEVYDTARFVEDAQQGRDLGYVGKLCVHPGQVSACHEVFTPSRDEIDLARRTLAAYEAANEQGNGVAVLDGRMIDDPHVRNARTVLRSAGLADGM